MSDIAIPLPDPAVSRVVEPTAQHPGMTQVCRDGRCVQLAGVGPDVEAAIEQHFTAMEREIGE